MSEKDNPTFDTTDGSSWRGSRGHVGMDVSAAVPSYRQATTTYRAPAAPSDDRNSNPSYRVATDEVGVKQPRSAGKPSAAGGGNAGSPQRTLILIVLCIALGILCIILLALAINYGVAYQNTQRGNTPPPAGRVVDPETSSTAASTTPTASSSFAVTVAASSLGQTEDGKPVTKYVMSNSRGVQVDLISIGARINALRVPTGNDNVDIVAGLNEANITNFQRSYLGAVNGPVCASTASSFTVGSQTYSLPSDGGFYVNGGLDGFYAKNYDSYVDAQKNVHFLYNGSAAGGAPGSMWVHATYQLTADNELIVSTTLTTNVASPVDMCSSVGFNLCGATKESLTGNKLQLFSTNMAMAANNREFSIDSAQNFVSESDVNQQLSRAFGALTSYDFTYRMANRPTGKSLLARAKCSTNNIAVEVYSNQPAVRVFATSAADAVDGKYGMNYTGTPYYLLQPQMYPLAVVTGKTTDYSSLLLSPTSQYRQETTFKLSTTGSP